MPHKQIPGIKSKTARQLNLVINSAKTKSKTKFNNVSILAVAVIAGSLLVLVAGGGYAIFDSAQKTQQAENIVFNLKNNYDKYASLIQESNELVKNLELNSYSNFNNIDTAENYISLLSNDLKNIEIAQDKHSNILTDWKIHESIQSKSYLHILEINVVNSQNLLKKIQSGYLTANCITQITLNYSEDLTIFTNSYIKFTNGNYDNYDQTSQILDDLVHTSQNLVQMSEQKTECIAEDQILFDKNIAEQYKEKQAIWLEFNQGFINLKKALIKNDLSQIRQATVKINQADAQMSVFDKSTFSFVDTRNKAIQDYYDFTKKSLANLENNLEKLAQAARNENKGLF